MTSHLKLVREWQGLCQDFAKTNGDPMVPAIIKSLDVLHATTRLRYDQQKTDSALLSLYNELQKTVPKENGNESLRVLMFGLMESMHLSLKAQSDRRKREEAAAQPAVAEEPDDVSVIELGDESADDDGDSVIELGSVQGDRTLVSVKAEDKTNMDFSVHFPPAEAKPKGWEVKEKGKETRKKEKKGRGVGEDEEMEEAAKQPVASPRRTTSPAAARTKRVSFREEDEEAAQQLLALAAGPRPSLVMPPAWTTMVAKQPIAPPRPATTMATRRKRISAQAMEKEEEKEAAKQPTPPAARPKRISAHAMEKEEKEDKQLASITSRPKRGASQAVDEDEKDTKQLVRPSTSRPKKAAAQTMEEDEEEEDTNQVAVAASRPKRIVQAIDYVRLNGGGAVRGKTPNPVGRPRKVLQGAAAAAAALHGTRMAGGGGVAKRSNGLKLKFSFKGSQARVHPSNASVHPRLLKCVLCERELHCVNAYCGHLQFTHHTTPTKEGLWFKCDCGNLSRSNGHEVLKQPKCGGSFSSLVKEGEKDKEAKKQKKEEDGEEEEVDDEDDEMPRLLPMDEEEGEEMDPERGAQLVQMALQGGSNAQPRSSGGANPPCFMCQTRPSTIGGYTYHLKTKHRTSLLANNYTIACSCGSQIKSCHTVLTHNRRRKCDGTSFKLIKVEVEEEEEMDEERNKGEEEEQEVEVKKEDEVKEEKVTERRSGRVPKRKLTMEEEDEAREAKMREKMEEERDKKKREKKMEKEDDEEELQGMEGWHPKCFLCEVRPASVTLFVLHLKTWHGNATLKKYGYALDCECGAHMTSEAGTHAHRKEGRCDGQKYSLKKVVAVEKKEEERDDEEKEEEKKEEKEKVVKEMKRAASLPLASFSLV